MNAETGRQLWAELHAYPLRFQGALTEAQQHEAINWLDGFAMRVGEASSGCACGHHWQALILGLPPDLSTGEAFLDWTQIIHDRVNQRLGKPLWRVAEGRW